MWVPMEFKVSPMRVGTVRHIQTREEWRAEWRAEWKGKGRIAMTQSEVAEWLVVGGRVGRKVKNDADRSFSTTGVVEQVDWNKYTPVAWVLWDTGRHTWIRATSLVDDSKAEE